MKNIHKTVNTRWGKHKMPVSSIWRRYCGSCGRQLFDPLLPLHRRANVNTVKEIDNVWISLEKYFDSSDPWKCLGNPRTPWTTLWEGLSWTARCRRDSEWGRHAPPAAGAAQPLPGSLQAGPGPPTQSAAKGGGMCLRWGHSSLQLQPLFLLARGSPRRVGAEWEAEVAQAAAAKTARPSRPTGGLCFRTHAGRQLLRGAEVGLGSGAGPYPLGLFAPQPLRAFSTQSSSSLHRSRECPNGGGTKKQKATPNLGSQIWRGVRNLRIWI